MYWIMIASLAILMLPILAVSAYSEENGSRIQEQVQKRLAEGEKANRLVKEHSPYLLQHAFNPVDWYPWGDDAFAKAKREDKPIFLSIGYSTCHWCHVMAHESFDNKEIAAILNKWFISIKVDREERPDIDQMYMAATQAMTGSGGWPMSVFLLPDGSPFYAGTYFPPMAMGNRPGFAELLNSIHQVWLDRRDDVQNTAKRLVAALETGGTGAATAIKPQARKDCYAQLEASYDSLEGGFGQAPKFPRPVIFSFLFSYFFSSGETKARDMALHTLRKMAAGGMYDQLGGGFHRYSVDEKWFVPHFEKMLYDQAQLVDAYLDAYQISGDPQFAGIAREIFAYLLRDMRDANGGFYSAEDADSDNPYNPGQHGEGAYYLWTREEIDKRLDAQTAEIFSAGFGMQDDGNVKQDPMGEFSGRNILFRAKSSTELASLFHKKTGQIRKSLDAARKLLLAVRKQRRPPHLDDKVITAWNGMTIGALARGSRILGDAKLLEAATDTASFLQDKLFQSNNTTLLRRYRNKEAGLAGQLADYACLVNGLLHLYQASQDPRWLSWSVKLTGQQIALFWNEEGGYFFDSVDDPTVRVRMKGIYDGAEPAANSVAAENLLLLSQLENKPQWQQMAQRLLESYSEVINHFPPALPLMLTVWQEFNSRPAQIIIAGEPGSADTEALLAEVERTYSRTRLLLLADGAENQEYLAARQPFLKNVVRLEGKATAYFCSDFTCRMPTTDPEVLRQQLAGKYDQ